MPCDREREPLRVAFDVTPVISGRTGIARYVAELGMRLERDDTKLRRFAVGRASFPIPEGTRRIRIPARLLERSWRVLPWPRIEQLIDPVDVVHATGMLTPSTRRPLVVTVHDVAALRHPELHPRRHLQQMRAQLEAVARAAAIIAVSGTTADDLAHLGVDPNRIVVAPLGAARLPQPSAPPPGLTPEGYLLTVGETSPRKGYGVLIRALARLDEDVRLVMAGPAADDEDRIRALAATLGVSNRISRLGAVSDQELAALYRGAIALCFPSIAEGFGLPVLEAMASGTPVVASDIPATRELAGDAALFVADRDEEAWAGALGVVASDSVLRMRLAEAGRSRASEFTWERTASATREAYQLALGAGR